MTLLRQYPEFADYWKPEKSSNDKTSEIAVEVPAQTPEDSISLGYLQLRKQVESELLAQVKSNHKTSKSKFWNGGWVIENPMVIDR